MLPDSIVSLIIDFKYSMEVHERHVQVMYELLKYHWSIMFRYVCNWVIRVHYLE